MPTGVATYRTVQEALANVHRHGQGRASVTLAVDESAASVGGMLRTGAGEHTLSPTAVGSPHGLSRTTQDRGSAAT
ncbi:MAG: hypothetical protein QM635_08225 [Microbacteriaceae bacterium]